MGHFRGGGGGGGGARCVGLAAVALLGIGCPAVRAGTWTWTGLGADDNWSTTNNWNPAGPPHSDDSTTLIFDGNNRLTPAQDLLDSFHFGNLAFTTNAGSFRLGGVTNVFGQPAWRSLQFSGTNTSLTVSGGGNVTINDALGTPDTAATQTITVASGMTLQVPWITGGQRRVVVKRGSGTLRVFEPCDGQRYLQNSCTVGPEYRVENGTVEAFPLHQSAHLVARKSKRRLDFRKCQPAIRHRIRPPAFDWETAA